MGCAPAAVHSLAALPSKYPDDYRSLCHALKKSADGLEPNALLKLAVSAKDMVQVLVSKWGLAEIDEVTGRVRLSAAGHALYRARAVAGTRGVLTGGLKGEDDLSRSSSAEVTATPQCSPASAAPQADDSWPVISSTEHDAPSDSLPPLRPPPMSSPPPAAAPAPAKPTRTYRGVTGRSGAWVATLTRRSGLAVPLGTFPKAAFAAGAHDRAALYFSAREAQGGDEGPLNFAPASYRADRRLRAAMQLPPLEFVQWLGGEALRADVAEDQRRSAIKRAAAAAPPPAAAPVPPPAATRAPPPAAAAWMRAAAQPPPPARTPPPPPAPAPVPAPAPAPAPPLSALAFGSKVQVWWSGDQSWYEATVMGMDASAPPALRHLLHYTADGFEEWTVMRDEVWRPLGAPPRRRRPAATPPPPQPAQTAAAPPPAAQPAAPAAAATLFLSAEVVAACSADWAAAAGEEASEETLRALRAGLEARAATRAVARAALASVAAQLEAADARDAATGAEVGRLRRARREEKQRAAAAARAAADEAAARAREKAAAAAAAAQADCE